MKSRAMEPTARDIADEADRLAEKGLLAVGYTENDLERCAQLTWKINQLKREKKAVIPAHVYQRAEIIHGIADFVGDSYKLAKDCAATKAEIIVFCGVRFMAETAKILNPEKQVYLPALEAGCSLADSITAYDVRKLKVENPGLPVVSYINTPADVKAESDVIVTSANATKILKKMFETHPRAHFPSRRMDGQKPCPGAWQDRRSRYHHLAGQVRGARKFRSFVGRLLSQGLSRSQSSGARGMQPGPGQSRGFCGGHRRYDALRRRHQGQTLYAGYGMRLR